jgi:hypothetical protein
VTTFAGSTTCGHVDARGAAAQFSFGMNEGVAVEAAGNVYVSEPDNNDIRKITPARVVTTLAGMAGFPGSADGTGGAARFFSPTGLGIDTAGNLCVSDNRNHPIRKVTPTGAVTTLAGSLANATIVDGNGSAAGFKHPVGIAVDANANVYVHDFGVLCKIDGLGAVTTVVGVPGIRGVQLGPLPGSLAATGTMTGLPGSPTRIGLAETKNVVPEADLP